MAKKEVKAHASSKKWNKYEVKDGTVSRKKTCPKCGVGVFLGQHKDRLHCGKCGYVEMKKH